MREVGILAATTNRSLIAAGAIDTAASFGDADTADLFTQVSRGVDKLLWLIEAHEQSKD